jgi:hypothetical protein
VGDIGHRTEHCGDAVCSDEAETFNAAMRAGVDMVEPAHGSGGKRCCEARCNDRFHGTGVRIVLAHG